GFAGARPVITVTADSKTNPRKTDTILLLIVERMQPYRRSDQAEGEAGKRNDEGRHEYACQEYHQLQRRPYSPPSGRGAWLGRAADRFPRRVSARHVLRVEAEIAQHDRGLAADVEAVHAEHHHRVGLRQLA